MLESQDMNFLIVGPGGTGPRWDNPKVAMFEEYEREQAIIEAERQARLAELHRLERLPFEELTAEQCIIVHGSDYPLCPGATPVADIFPEHGVGVPPLYSDPTLPLHDPGPWGQRVDTIIEQQGPGLTMLATGQYPYDPLIGKAPSAGEGNQGLGLVLGALFLL